MSLPVTLMKKQQLMMVLVYTMIALVIVVWTHACMGLHFWLRLKRWYRRRFLLLFALAILIPTLAIAGFVTAGKSISAERALKQAKRADVIMEHIQPASPLLTLASFNPAQQPSALTPPPANQPILVAQQKGGWSYGKIIEYAKIGQVMFGAFALLVVGSCSYCCCPDKLCCCLRGKKRE